MKQFFKKIAKEYFRHISCFNTGKTVLFPHINYTLLPIIKNAISNNCRILFLKNEDIKFNWKYLDETEINNERLNFLVKNEIAKSKIDYFVIDRLTRNNLLYHLVLKYCNLNSVETIYLEHGHSGTEYNYYNKFFEMNFDYYYATDKYMYNNVADNTKNLKVRQWILPRKILKQNKDDNLILFIPAPSSGDRFLRLYPETSVYKNREKILDILENICITKKKRVIYKPFPDSEEGIDAIPNLIECKYKHIENSNEDFYKLVSKARFVITDYFSTSLYDAILHNCCCLFLRYNKSSQLRTEYLNDVHFRYMVYDFMSNDKSKINIAIQSLLYCNTYIDPKYLEFKQDKFPWEEKSV